MRKRWYVLLGMMLAVGFATGFAVARLRPPAVLSEHVADTPLTKPAPNEIFFPPGSPQLAMLRAEPLPAVAMPAGETLSGKVAYDEDVTARVSTSISGKVVAIRAATGDRVRRGQLLAEIDSPDLGTAIADLNKALADEERKRNAFARLDGLAPGEAVAAKDIEAARADLAQAHAETSRASLRANSLNPGGMRVNGQRLLLTAPLDGVVVERNITPSMEVGVATPAPLFVVSKLADLWLNIDLPEAMLGRAVAGAEVDVESDAYPGEHFRARILHAGQLVDTNSRRVVVRARLDNSSGKLLPEMFVRSVVLRANGSAVKVPNTSLVTNGLHSFVYVETSPGHYQRRQVSIALRGSDSSFIQQGVSGGERIVTGGALLLDAEMGVRAGNAL